MYTNSKFNFSKYLNTHCVYKYKKKLKSLFYLYEFYLFSLNVYVLKVEISKSK